MDNDATHKVTTNIEFNVQFSRVTQWLPYSEVKHLLLLEDYALHSGLSWLKRSSPTPQQSVPKSLDTARNHVHKARVRKAHVKGKVNVVWSPLCV